MGGVVSEGHRLGDEESGESIVHREVTLLPEKDAK
jgi:hypothetical protein